MILKKMTPQGEIPMTTDEQAAFVADQTSMTAAIQSQQLVEQAKALIIITDMVFMRCGKHAVAWPPEWQAYYLSLLEIVRTATGVLPEQPTYPAGT